MHNQFKKLEIRAQRSPWHARVELLIIRGGTELAEPIVFKEQNESLVPEPTVRISHEQAQTLMDDLWECGLRPTEGKGSAGSLAATERHLKDMQGIVRGSLKKLGIEFEK